MLSLTSSSTSPSPDTERDKIILLLQKWGLSSIAASTLETGGAFATLAAQGLYVAEPLLSTWVSGSVLQNLAQTLEDPLRSAELARALRESQA